MGHGQTSRHEAAMENRYSAVENRNSDPIVTVHLRTSIEQNAGQELAVGGQGEEPSLSISAVRAAEVLGVLVGTEGSSCCLPTEQAGWVCATG